MKLSAKSVKRLLVVVLALFVATHASAWVKRSDSHEEPAAKAGLDGRLECLVVDVGGGRSRNITVYLPKCYDTGIDSLPLMYLLHGLKGDELVWTVRGNAAATADSLVRHDLAKPFIMAMPDCSPHFRHKSRGTLPNMLKYPRWLRKEFENEFMGITYRVKGSQRVIAGLSAGATQAANLALMHDSTVRCVGLFSPVLHKRHVPQALSKTAYWIEVGRHDIFLSESKRFARRASERGIDCTIHITNGRHTWTNWKHYLADFILFAYGDALQ